MEKKTWNTAAHIHNNPVKSISEGGDEPVFRFYRDLIVAKINDEPHYYHKEVMHISSPPSFVRCWDSFTRKLMLPIRGTARKKVPNAGLYPAKFVELLSKDKVCTAL